MARRRRREDLRSSSLSGIEVDVGAIVAGERVSHNHDERLLRLASGAQRVRYRCTSDAAVGRSPYDSTRSGPADSGLPIDFARTAVVFSVVVFAPAFVLVLLLAPSGVGVVHVSIAPLAYIVGARVAVIAVPVEVALVEPNTNRTPPSAASRVRAGRAQNQLGAA